MWGLGLGRNDADGQPLELRGEDPGPVGLAVQHLGQLRRELADGSLVHALILPPAGSTSYDCRT